MTTNVSTKVKIEIKIEVKIREVKVKILGHVEHITTQKFFSLI